ncbi:MAG TPA: hypothetical protein VF828_04050 [Patescibacteria group bacterium]
MDNDGCLLSTAAVQASAMTLSQKLILVIVLSLGLLPRLYKINNPVADWHSHRQADTASVTRNFDTKGINFLVPTYHDLSNVQSGSDNPQGYRMVELPVYNLLSEIFFRNTQKLFPQISLEMASRWVSLIFSLGSAFMIFMVVYQNTNSFWPSLLASAVFLFLPFSIYYSRAILPGSTAMFFMLLALYLFRINIIFSALAFALAVLIRPFTAFIITPTLAVYTFQKYLKILSIKNLVYLIIFSIISMGPFFWWRHWIQQFSAGIPSSAWLFNVTGKPFLPEWIHGFNVSFINHFIAFRPMWFNWLFHERLAKLILASYGLIPFFLGFAYRKNNAQKLSFSLFAGMIFYFIIVAGGNIRHDYYQFLIMPVIAIIVGFGLYYMANFVFKSLPFSIFSVVIISLATIYFSWSQISPYYNINNPDIIDAGRKVNEIIPKNSLVVAPYQGDTAFLYQTNHSGYPTEIYDVTAIKKENPSLPLYFVSVNYDNYTNSMIKTYKTIYRNDHFIILDLN